MNHDDVIIYDSWAEEGEGQCIIDKSHVSNTFLDIKQQRGDGAVMTGSSLENQPEVKPENRKLCRTNNSF